MNAHRAEHLRSGFGFRARVPVSFLAPVSFPGSGFVLASGPGFVVCGFGLKFRVRGLGFRVQGLWFRDEGYGYRG